MRLAFCMLYETVVSLVSADLRIPICIVSSTIGIGCSFIVTRVSSEADFLACWSICNSTFDRLQKVRGMIEKFVSFSDTEKKVRILSKLCHFHIEIKYISSNWMLLEKQL